MRPRRDQSVTRHGRLPQVSRLFFCLTLWILLAASNAWSLSPAERGAIWARTWELVRERFVGTEELSRVKWASSYESRLRELEQAPSDVEFWRRLRVLICDLQNGRTRVKLPNGLPRVYDLVPIKLILVGDQLIVKRLSSSSEVERSGIRPGDLLMSVDGVPALEALQTVALPHTSGSRQYARLAASASRVLTGLADTKPELAFRRPNGKEYTVRLPRDSGHDNKYYRDLGESVDDELKIFDGRIAYVNARFNFVWNLEQVIFSALDDPRVETLILDLRETDAGIVSDRLLARLALSPLPANRHRSIAWESMESNLQPGTVDWKRSWDTTAARIIVPAANAFKGKLIALVGPETSGPAEQLLEPLFFAGRVTLIGDTTAGSGHSFTVLPFGNGAQLSVATTDPLWESGYGDGVGFPPHIVVRPSA